MGFSQFKGRFLSLLLFRSLLNFMEGECNLSMANSHGSIHTVVHDNLLQFYPVLDLVEFCIVLYDVIVSYGPWGLDAEDCIQIDLAGLDVEVIPRVGRYCKPSVIDGKVMNQEPVCFFNSADSFEPHLLYHPVLERFEQPLDPAFSLG